MILPKNPSHVMDMVKKEYRVAKQKVISELTLQITSGIRFSISMDEYTSIKNRRYLNIHVHSYTNIWNLGMVRILGSLPAEKTLTMVKNKLAEFNLCMSKHIISSITNGAAVMKKFERLSDCEHQNAHGLHLAVCDVLYKKASETETESSEDENLLNGNVTDPDDSDGENEIDFGDIIFSASNGDHNLHSIELNEQLQNDVSIPRLIEKVRKIVRMFRKSPLKNETLQKYVKIEFNTELQLLLDIKIRWNSLLVMLERFAKLKTSIFKAMLDLEQTLNIHNHNLL